MGTEPRAQFELCTSAVPVSAPATPQESQVDLGVPRVAEGLHPVRVPARAHPPGAYPTKSYK
jgi:hypothetical protein